MLVVHALWSPRAGFCFWAEDSDLVRTLVMRAPGRGLPVLPPLLPHPFAVPARVVSGVLGLGPAGEPGGGVHRDGDHGDGDHGDGDELTLMLPENAWGPIPSPAARERPAVRPTRTEQIRPWRVPVVPLPAAAAVDLLLDRPGPTGTEAEPVMVGGAWHWLATVADTAVELVARGRARPGIVESGGGEADAGWMPDPDATDAARIRSLVASIPPLARVESNGTGNEPPPRSEVIVAGALAAMVDTIVRSAMADWRLVPAGAGAGAGGSPAEPATGGGLPPWWRSPAARLGLRLRARPRPGPGLEGEGDGRGDNPFTLGLAGVCDYHFEVAAGDVTLTDGDLARLATMKGPFVQLHGQWIELRAGDVDRARAVLAGAATGSDMGTGEWPPGGSALTTAQVIRIGLGLEAAPGAGLPVIGVVAEGWLGDLLAGAADEQRLEPLPTPGGFEGRLRPYQERGLAWLSFLGGLGLGACLADDMGLGKTAQLLALLVAEREAAPGGTRDPARGGRRPRLAPTLLVCPMSLVGNWQREAARFAPGLAVHVHHGSDREVGAAFTRAVRRADLVITTYSLLARDRAQLARVRWGRLALDEAQNVKNPAAQAARAARSIPAGTRVALTGTPVENRLRELWALMDFLNPGLLGSEQAFRDRFAVPVERYRDEEAAGTLRRLTGPFILRRLKTDRSIIADLPEKIEMHVLCNLTREQADLYQGIVDEMLEGVAAAATGIARMGLISGAMTKLKQVCNHPAHYLGDGSRLAGDARGGGVRSGKLARLEEVLEEITALGERALCFTQFAEMGTLLQSHLRSRLDTEVPFLHGGVAKRARDRMVADFQADSGPPLLLLSLKAGGVGLNLTAANHVIHFDRWWNPAVEDQATDRAFRIGQRRDVQVRKFVCVGTIEERIDRMIEEKRDLAERTVGTGEAWISDLSVAQLRDLVALSEDAVAEA